MRKAFWAMMVCYAASASGAMPAVAQNLPYCIKGCDFGGAWRPLPVVTPIVRSIPISTPKPKCYLIGTCPEEGSDAYLGLANFAIAAVWATGPGRAQTCDPHL
jgi:hypothetical protein